MNTKALLSAATITLAMGASHSALAGEPGWNNQDVKGSITFFTNRTDLVEQGHYARWVEEFKTKYPAVQGVEVVGLSDYRGQLQPRMQTQDFGDVVFILSSIPRDQYSHFFMPLNDLGLQADIYFEDLWSVSGKHYGYTQGVSAEGLVYNKTAFAQAGIEVPLKTLDDLHSAAQKLKSNDVVPLTINMGAGWPMQQWDKLASLYAGDYGYYDAMLQDESPFEASKPHGQAIDFVRTFFNNGWTEEDYVGNNWEESKGRMARGENAMWFFGNWSIPQIGIYNENWQDEIGFMPLPIDNSGQPKALLSNDWGYGVSAFSKNPTTAKAWVRFLIAETDYAAAAGFIPTVKAQSASMPQLQEIMSYSPEIIEVKPTSAKFTAAANKARIDVFGGTYIRELLLEDNFDKAVAKINKRWNKARQRVK